MIHWWFVKRVLTDNQPSMKFKSEYEHFRAKWCVWKCSLPIGSHFVWFRFIITTTPHGRRGIPNHQQVNCLLNSVWLPTSTPRITGPFVMGIHWWPVSPVMWKPFPYHDVMIIFSSYTDPESGDSTEPKSFRSICSPEVSTPDVTTQYPQQNPIGQNGSKYNT